MEDSGWELNGFYISSHSTGCALFCWKAIVGTNVEPVEQAFLSQLEPKNVEEALKDADWIVAMQDELNQFEKNKVWHLVPRPSDRSVIETH